MSRIDDLTEAEARYMGLDLFVYDEEVIDEDDLRFRQINRIMTERSSALR